MDEIVYFLTKENGRNSKEIGFFKKLFIRFELHLIYIYISLNYYTCNLKSELKFRYSALDSTLLNY